MAVAVGRVRHLRGRSRVASGPAPGRPPDRRDLRACDGAISSILEAVTSVLPSAPARRRHPRRADRRPDRRARPQRSRQDHPARRPRRGTAPRRRSGGDRAGTRIETVTQSTTCRPAAVCGTWCCPPSARRITCGPRTPRSARCSTGSGCPGSVWNRGDAAVRGRATPGRAGRRAGHRRRPAGAGRTDQPPGHRRRRLARRAPGGRRAAVIVVTHDRWFLDAVAAPPGRWSTARVHIRDGGYSDWVFARAERLRLDGAAEERRRNLARKELAWLRRGPPARTSKPRYRIEAAEAIIADVPAPRDTVELPRFAGRRLGKDVLDLEDVTVTFPAPGSPRPLLDDVTWRIGPGDRVGVIGSNGAGKSTLLKVSPASCLGTGAPSWARPSGSGCWRRSGRAARRLRVLDAVPRSPARSPSTAGPDRGSWPSASASPAQHGPGGGAGLSGGERDGCSC